MATQKKRPARSGNWSKIYGKSLMDHVHPFVWSCCMFMLCLSWSISEALDKLGFNVSAPANRIASAYARGYELQVERQFLEGDEREMLNQLLEKFDAIIDKMDAMDERVQHVESLAHPEGGSSRQ